MADPLSTTANTIAVAQLTYFTVKTVYQTITGLRDGPKSLQDLGPDLENLHKTINSMQQELEKQGNDANLSDEQKQNLIEIQPSLQGCHSICRDFQDKINNTLRHSKDGRVSFRDRLMVQFKENEIAEFRKKLLDFKTTFIVCIDLLNFKSISQNLERTKSLEYTFEKTANMLLGRIEELRISKEEILESSLVRSEIQQPDASEVLSAIEQHTIILTHCQKSIMAALQQTTKTTGHSYKNIALKNTSRVMMGDMGQVQRGAIYHSYDGISVEGPSIVVAGNMDGNVAKDFLNMN
ncbi:hypothetical protein BGW36DRAFT_355425 [Talaromyces proteolyticus]|uniref:Azaphilone pigments biosynthesis cluster protein L N-terminal domain-containing protein n=1 Tax=Talaromyces proteolyticus TaxID=1131652 RepID=A0AAD4Q5A4_9EURO|nr:uncharacterized protein BGW36DRAFT_355425 [Talaromyces proteolyticus]KAH8704046.1 hypothetical protein BGW36DRAFT_355425 [Talaromyces proteolyticus]